MKYDRKKGDTLKYLNEKQFAIKSKRKFEVLSKEQLLLNYFFSGKCNYCKKYLKKDCKTEIKGLRDFLTHIGHLEI